MQQKSIPLWFLTAFLLQSIESFMSTLKKLRESRGLSQPELARRVGTSQPQILRLEKSQRKLSKEWAEKLAPHLGVTAEELMFGKPQEAAVEIVGLAGADTEGQRIYGHGQGQLGWVESIPGATETTVAVIVRGSSMRPYAEDGGIIYYDDRRDPPSSEMLGEVVIIGLEDDRVLLKRLLRPSSGNPGHFDLESFNGDQMPNQRVLWAAYVSAVIPPRQAKKIIKEFL
ncbi:helix-turn-helix domain-containing protein [Agrobacterium tumefaciens]|nr:helix-turn-helix domain-containing protein [Agrobacterium tumefaciens]